MSKRVKTVLAIVSIALVGGIVWKAEQPPEFVYEGRTLRSWLKVYNQTAGRQQREAADQAVQRIGTNAIPTLLRLLRAKDSTMKTKVIFLARSQRVISIQWAYAGEWNQMAARAFSSLGTNAQIAVPALIHIADENVSATSRSYAIYALGCIGPSAKEAVPSLLLWATNEVLAVRRYARLSLIRIDPEAAARLGGHYSGPDVEY